MKPETIKVNDNLLNKKYHCVYCNKKVTIFESSIVEINNKSYILCIECLKKENEKGTITKYIS